MCLSLKHVPMLMERYKWRKRRKRCRRGKGCFSVQIADTVERAGIKNRDEELASSGTGLIKEDLLFPLKRKKARLGGDL